MQIIILSGLSGAGKSVALHMLEDLGFYCIDNIPAALLKPFISYTVRSNEKLYARTAIGLDARNSDADFGLVPTLIDELKRSAIDCAVLFLVADDPELLRRFAETRRAHPLGRQGETLREAIASERRLLEPIADIADQVIDTSRMGVHQLRELINRRVDPRSPDRLSMQFESFGFKHGIPGDADFVFDARSLPNPYWESALRPLTGRDAAGGALSRGAARRARVHRRHRQVHECAHSGLPCQLAPISDRGGGLHGRATPLRLYRRAPGRALCAHATGSTSAPRRAPARQLAAIGLATDQYANQHQTTTSSDAGKPEAADPGTTAGDLRGIIGPTLPSNLKWRYL